LDLDHLYTLLKAAPRDARWLMRRVGDDYIQVMEELRAMGRPVEVKMEEVDGMHRAVYRAADQVELFPAVARKRRRRRRRAS
jgi:hypothetical protein